MTSWQPILRRSVLDVGAYSPGVSAAEIKARHGIRDVVRLNWNENLYSALPGVLDETAAELAESWAYPEESHEEFRHAVAQWAGATPDQVIPGHGIQALTLALVNAFVEPGDSVVIPRPTYGVYAQACGTAGAVLHRVECAPSLAFDLDAIATAARRHRAKLVWICDPNNPTGLRLKAAAWTGFLDSLPESCVAIVDEAYCDYIEPALRTDRLADVHAGRPVVILRTFSKIFGLAGLRLGYAIVHESLAPFVNAVHEPFNVNRAALAAGLSSLRRTELLPGRREQVRSARERLSEPLTAGGIRCLPSDANFVLVDLAADDVRVADALARDGVLVRAGSEFGLPGYARVTTASEELMDAVAGMLIGALAAIA
jgi:histidinol-phosphate aminotransferase